MSADKAAMLQALGTPFPQSALKQRVGGGNSRFTYVEGFTIIHRLNDATGGAWDWTIKSFEFRPLPPDRNGKEQSLVVVTGELTIPGLGTRAGIGVQKVSENGGEDLVKGASTDALKKAATLFGVALELYGPDYEAGESATPTRDQSRRSDPPTNLRPAAALTAAGTPTDQDALVGLLTTIRDDLADPKARKKALHEYYGAATTIGALNVAADNVAKSGLPEADLKAAYKWHHTRLGKEFASASAAG